jgi:hypothetical protein
LRPWIAARPAGLSRYGSAAAKAKSSSAEGSVNATNAASAPGHPARSRPRLNPSLLLAGPGRNWQSASSCANCASSSQRRRSTNSARR